MSRLPASPSNSKSLSSGEHPSEGTQCSDVHRDGTSKTHKPVIISHHWLFVLRKRSELWKECFIGDVLMITPLILPSCCSPQEESPSARQGVQSEWRLQNKQDRQGVASSPVTTQDSPYSYLVHIIRKEGPQASSLESYRSSQRPDGQADLKTLHVTPDNGTRSRWLIFRDGLITMTDISHQPTSQTAKACPPFHPSPSSPFPSTWWRRRKT